MRWSPAHLPSTIYITKRRASKDRINNKAEQTLLFHPLLFRRLNRSHLVLSKEFLFFIFFLINHVVPALKVSSHEAMMLLSVPRVQRRSHMRISNHLPPLANGILPLSWQQTSASCSHVYTQKQQCCGLSNAKPLSTLGATKPKTEAVLTTKGTHLQRAHTSAQGGD